MKSKKDNLKKDDIIKVEALHQLKKIMSRCKDKRCYATVKHISSSGMSRCIHFVAITKNGDQYNLDGIIHRITGYRFSNYDGLHICGCGMDMIFHVLYTLNSYACGYNIIKKSKNKTAHDNHYNGIINTYYNYF